MFYPDKALGVQVTVNHIETSDKSYVYDAVVSWVENVNYDRFKVNGLNPGVSVVCVV